MSIETYLSFGALIVAIVGAVVSSRKSSADIAKTKIETEKLLREMLDDETTKRKKLEEQVDTLNRKFNDLSAYVGELVAGIDLLVEQITVKHKDTPVWQPNRRKDDPK